MIARIRHFIGLLLLLSFALPAQAGEIVSIFGYRFQARLEDGQTYSYNRFLKAIRPQLKIESRLTVEPARRAWIGFEKTEHACVFPSNIGLAYKNNPSWKAYNLQDSAAIDHVTAHFFVRKGEAAPKSKEDLAHKSVAYMRGFAFARRFGVESTRFYETTGQRRYLKMLDEGRVNIVLGWMPGMEVSVRELGMEMPDRDPDWIVASASTHLVCKDTPITQKFMADFDAKLQAMKDNGMLQNVLEAWAKPAL